MAAETDVSDETSECCVCGVLSYACAVEVACDSDFDCVHDVWAAETINRLVRPEVEKWSGASLPKYAVTEDPGYECLRVYGARADNTAETLLRDAWIELVRVYFSEQATYVTLGYLFGEEAGPHIDEPTAYLIWESLRETLKNFHLVDEIPPPPQNDWVVSVWSHKDCSWK